jgi:hypothetical protein
MILLADLGSGLLFVSLILGTEAASDTFKALISHGAQHIAKSFLNKVGNYTLPQGSGCISPSQGQSEDFRTICHSKNFK